VLVVVSDHDDVLWIIGRPEMWSDWDGACGVVGSFVSVWLDFYNAPVHDAKVSVSGGLDGEAGNAFRRGFASPDEAVWPVVALHQESCHLRRNHVLCFGGLVARFLEEAHQEPVERISGSPSLRRFAEGSDLFTPEASKLSVVG